jgi:hypothetical protein
MSHLYNTYMRQKQLRYMSDLYVLIILLYISDLYNTYMRQKKIKIYVWSL